MPLARPQPDWWGVVWVRGRDYPAVRGAHGGYGFSALLRVVLDAEVSSSVLTAESQTLRLNGPELVARLVRALQLDPLKFVGLRVAMAKSRCARLGPSQADPNVRCHDGTTPLHFAAAHGQARTTP